MTQAIAANELSLTMTRRFEATREAVFKAWTDPLQMARWVGPRSVKAEILALDARPGGGYRIAMQQASGTVNVVGGEYREVAPPERLVFTWAWEDSSPTHRRGHESLITVTFRQAGTGTEMTLHQVSFPDEQSRASHQEGWGGSFDNLGEILAGRPGPRG